MDNAHARGSVQCFKFYVTCYPQLLTVGHLTGHADLDAVCLECVYKLTGPTPLLLPNCPTELQGKPALTGPWNDFPFKEQMRCECSKSPVFVSSISTVHPVHVPHRGYGERHGTYHAHAASCATSPCPPQTARLEGQTAYVRKDTRECRVT
jgi:hypothetical protein